MTDGNGNILARDDSPIEAGDWVRITPDAFAQARMTPIELWKTGHPAEFFVVETLELRGEPCLKIYPCCDKWVNRATGKLMCNGHPAKWFSRAEPPPGSRQQGDMLFGVDSPWGPVLSLDYIHDEHAPALALDVAGRGIVKLSGGLARRIAEAVRENGLF